MSQHKPGQVQRDLTADLREVIHQVVGNTTAVELVYKLEEYYVSKNIDPPPHINPAEIASILQHLSRKEKIINLVETASDGDVTRDVYAPYQDPDIVQ